MNKEETIKNIHKATSNPIAGEKDTVELFYDWHIAEIEKAEQKVISDVFDILGGSSCDMCGDYEGVLSEYRNSIMEEGEDK